jgi:hypothetical protein
MNTDIDPPIIANWLPSPNDNGSFGDINCPHRICPPSNISSNKNQEPRGGGLNKNIDPSIIAHWFPSLGGDDDNDGTCFPPTLNSFSGHIDYDALARRRPLVGEEKKKKKKGANVPNDGRRMTATLPPAAENIFQVIVALCGISDNEGGNDDDDGTSGRLPTTQAAATGCQREREKKKRGRDDYVLTMFTYGKRPYSL